MDAFTLKGSLYTLTTLQLKTTDLTAIAEQLTVMVKQVPRFFANTPLVIDLQKVSQPFNLHALLDCLYMHQLIPVGVRGGSEEQKSIALTAGMALMPGKQDTNDSSVVPATADHTNVVVAGTGKLVTQPVRSGQQIYAQGGDLIILSPVSAGAEVLADGHIHVYAPLRGRALAGVAGNTQARIFCQYLAAELVAIAGHYKVSEQLQNQLGVFGKTAMIYLDNDQLAIEPM